MISLEQDDLGGGFTDLLVEWDSFTTGMDTGVAPDENSFRAFIDSNEVTITNAAWQDAFVLALTVSAAIGSASQVDLLVEDANLKNDLGITAKAPQVITQP